MKKELSQPASYDIEYINGYTLSRDGIKAYRNQNSALIGAVYQTYVRDIRPLL